MSRGFFFDCDGVLLDSNQIKTEAFRTVGGRWDRSAAEQLVEYHVANGGISRFEKFRFFFDEIFQVSDPERAQQEAVERFALEVRTRLAHCAEVAGVKEVLARLSSIGEPLWVVSGGAEEEVQWILKERDLSRYFQGIRGSPATKPEIIDEILGVRTPFKRMVFFGDSASDQRAALEFEMDFVYVWGCSEWTPSASEAESISLRIKDFQEGQSLRDLGAFIGVRL